MLLRCKLFLCFWIYVPSHDAMNPPAVVFEWFQVWVRTLADVASVRFRLFVSQQVFLQTLHCTKPAEANRTADRLDGRLAGTAPLVKNQTDGVRKVSVAVGTVHAFGWACKLICNPCTFASIPWYVPSEGTASCKSIPASCAHNPPLLLWWIW